jgi:hypothetical protein
VLLAPVPYALKASDSDTLGGKPAAAYALAGSPTVVELTGVAASANPMTAASKVDATAGKEATSQPLTACTVTSDGTATASTVAKFTTACNLENSLIRDNGTGVAVGGTATPAALFDVQFTSTATSGTVWGQRAFTTVKPAAASTASTSGFFSNALTASGNTETFNGNLYATSSEVDHNGTGSLGYAFGLKSAVFNRTTGTIADAYGINVALANLAKGKITNGYGLYVTAPVNSGGGTFSNYSGVYIASPTAVTGAYGLYSAGGKNYFAGDVGIGTTTPAANLEVDGTTKFDGLVTFASGQTFPGGGGGTVTSVGSGAGLTGGPIKTTGTLSISSAGVTDTMLANSYSGVGSCTTGTVVNGLTRNAAPSCVTAGTGTVTSVASGTGLTGGPITTSGTLSVDTSKVPTLAASTNNYTGEQSISTSASTALYAATTTSGGVGVFGGSSGYGVVGDSLATGYPGVQGLAPSGGQGTQGLAGVSSGTYTNSAGVYGEGSSTGNGVMGVTSGLYAGVFGWAVAGEALEGVNDSVSYPTLFIENTTSGSLSSYYIFKAFGNEVSSSVYKGCTIDVLGNLTCSGSKSAAVPVAGGREVALYAVEAPENWFEDYGSGKLDSGVATITLDPLFLQTVNAEVEYHVFLTPGGDCNGLYVAQKTPTSFEVRELGKGTSDVAFDYRVIVRRKGYEKLRMEDATEKFRGVAQPVVSSHPRPLGKR